MRIAVKTRLALSFAFTIALSAATGGFACPSLNQAIQQLDRVTQQNAAASDEVSATASELNAQAERLNAAISFFRLGEDRTVGRAVTSPRERAAAVRAAEAKRKAPGKSALRGFALSPVDAQFRGA